MQKVATRNARSFGRTRRMLRRASAVGLDGGERWERTLFGDALCDIHAGDVSVHDARPLIHTHLFRRQPTQRLAELGSIGVPDC